jgi:hypothetical protein
VKWASRNNRGNDASNEFRPNRCIFNLDECERRRAARPMRDSMRTRSAKKVLLRSSKKHVCLKTPMCLPKNRGKIAQ